MSSDTRILNLSRNCKLKKHQAESRIAAGVMAWVEPGKTVRELSLPEILEFRTQRRKFEEVLEPKEVPNVIEMMPRSQTWTPQVKHEVLCLTREFYEGAVSV